MVNEMITAMERHHARPFPWCVCDAAVAAGVQPKGEVKIGTAQRIDACLEYQGYASYVMQHHPQLVHSTWVWSRGVHKLSQKGGNCCVEKHEYCQAAAPKPAEGEGAAERNFYVIMEEHKWEGCGGAGNFKDKRIRAQTHVGEDVETSSQQQG